MHLNPRCTLKTASMVTVLLSRMSLVQANIVILQAALYKAAQRYLKCTREYKCMEKENILVNPPVT